MFCKYYIFVISLKITAIVGGKEEEKRVTKKDRFRSKTQEKRITKAKALQPRPQGTMWQTVSQTGWG
jgi:hypothetical protein